ncbi:putative baseplate assembly protein [Leptolyngbya cf. ectocarpi LEGE 11479]|uniref:Baseplate assembly protein n=1 Tax=Leptolyngbya cf. ectocarpi LEGE 11479 TaxID=1828722 RepID=A0A928ZSL7_LEPEC|nr:putative baseplate assembly protein [Leptolyngbya ectocarpi]MBE9066447.1 putative baseplate assembly protein [Leptolyngbya cf. ectocarpi LEGE 11479]
MTNCCPCDKLIHPGKPEIPAGLVALPRQLAEFSDYRLAMLRKIPNYPALAQWRAREGNDLGIMLLEMWAYVLDSLAFYDERIANETYLRTAVRQASLYKLVGLIGYYPRPALAATVVLGAIAEGRQQIVLPPRTGFRSDAFDGEPPQIFETEIDQPIHPFLNEWELADMRAPSAPKELLLALETARLAAEQLVLVKTSDSLQVSKVVATSTITALDGNSYVQVTAKPEIAFAPTVQLSDIEVLTPERTAQPNLMTESAVISPFFSAPVLIILDAIYPELAEGEPVIVQRGSDLFAANLVTASRTDISVGAGDPPPTLPVTIIVLDRFLPEAWTFAPSRLRIHFQLVNAGTVTRVAKTQLKKADFETPGIPIEGLAEPLPDDVSTSGQLLLQDANNQGLQAGGTTLIAPQGNGRVVLNTDTSELVTPLRTSVTVFGNLVRASRGESVLDEVLGSGDGTQTFQAFMLQKTPLTYLSDPAAGRRSTLSIRVNGILWREVVSFFGTGSQDEVFIARQNDQQETTITFGDGVTGARLPTGINNVTATYRFGGGAAKPPAGAIAQIARPFKGLRRVVNPVAAVGGADSDRPEDIRLNAPTSALTLGRAVSIQDFEALAREFGGVVNAQAGWAWDESRQGAVVKVWFIADGTNPDFVQALTDSLLSQADPTTPLTVCPAVAQPSNLVIDVSLDPRFSRDLVLEEIRQALVNEATGLFALTNIPIGRPLFRSQIFATVLAVEGACGVSAITLDGVPVPFAITAAEGRYRDLFSKLAIAGTAATEVNAR